MSLTAESIEKLPANTLRQEAKRQGIDTAKMNVSEIRAALKAKAEPARRRTTTTPPPEVKNGHSTRNGTNGTNGKHAATPAAAAKRSKPEPEPEPEPKPRASLRGRRSAPEEAEATTPESHLEALEHRVQELEKFQNGHIVSRLKLLEDAVQVLGYKGGKSGQLPEELTEETVAPKAGRRTATRSKPEPEPEPEGSDDEDILAEWRGDEGYLDDADALIEGIGRMSMPQLKALADECGFEYPSTAKAVPIMRKLARAWVEEQAQAANPDEEEVEGPNGERAQPCSWEDRQPGDRVYVRLEDVWYAATVMDPPYQEDEDGQPMLVLQGDDGDDVGLYHPDDTDERLVGFIVGEDEDEG